MDVVGVIMRQCDIDLGFEVEFFPAVGFVEGFFGAPEYVESDDGVAVVLALLDLFVVGEAPGDARNFFDAVLDIDTAGFGAGDDGDHIA